MNISIFIFSPASAYSLCIPQIMYLPEMLRLGDLKYSVSTMEILCALDLYDQFICNLILIVVNISRET